MKLLIFLLPFLLIGVFIEGGITSISWWIKCLILDIATILAIYHGAP
jgi:hypothetical protein